MTTKQIAEAVGKDERSIQRWAKATGVKVSSIGDKVSSVQKTGRPADYTLEETCLIIEHGMGKNAADLFRMSAKESASSDSRLDRLEAMVGRLVEAVAATLPRVATPAPLSLPAPALSPRDELRQIIGRAARESGDYQGTWREFYEAIYYRMHRKIRECAKNRGVDSLDYLESEGLLPEAIALARDIFEAK